MTWKFKEKEFKQGKSGKAKIKHQNGNVLVRFADDKQVYTCDRAESWTPIPDKPDGLFMVKLHSDGDKIFGCSPWSGAFDVKFIRFAAKKDHPPIPREKTGTGQQGQFTYYTYTAMFEIVEGEKNVGCEVPHYLSYNFQDIGEMAAHGSKKSKYTKQNVAFFSATGIDEEQMEYSTNLLPEMEKIAQSKGYTSTIFIQNGYIDSIARKEGEVVSEDDFDFGSDFDDPVDPEVPQDDPFEDDDDELGF